MLTVDEQIELAEKIAQALPEVTRNEWLHWVQIVQKQGLERAIQRAERLAQDITLRPAVKRANQLIAQAIRKHLKELKGLREEDQQAVLGYISQSLTIQTKRGSLQL